jgi:predicted metal-dependent hydrolase
VPGRWFFPRLLRRGDSAAEGAAPAAGYGNISPMAQRALLYRRPSEPSAITIAFEREIYLVRVRRHRQARRYTLRIHSATREVLLTMPPRGSLKQAREFAQKHGGWIAARLDRIPEPTPFAHGTLLPLRGVDHRIEHRAGARGTVWIEEDGDQRMLCVAGEAPHVARRVRDFLKREAKSDLEAASRRAAATLGIAVKRVSIRDQSSRWGSCSTTGVLSYSWRLILAPPFVLDYLAAHEVAHLIEMNHSRAFWRLVERICPHATRAKTWLDAHGADLHRFGLQHDARS